jgi:hypothetical protein
MDEIFVFTYPCLARAITKAKQLRQSELFEIFRFG